MSDIRPLNPAAVIVVAEDDELLRMAVVELLTDDGFEVLEARHAEEALSNLCEHAGRVQILFTDINMPGPMKSAKDAAARIRVFSPAIQPVRLT